MSRGVWLRSTISRAAYPLLVAAGDGAAFYAALWVSFELRVRVFERWVPLPFTQSFADLLSRLWMPAVLVVVFAFEGLYTRREPFWEETRNAVRAVFLSFLAIFTIVSLGKLSGEISRAVVVGTGILSLGLVPLVRVVWKPFLHRKGIGIKRTVLLGSNASGRLAVLGLFRDHYMGIRVAGVLDCPGEGEGVPLRFRERPRGDGRSGGLTEEPPPLLPVLGSLGDLPDLAASLDLRGAVVAMPHLKREELSLLIERVQRSVLSVYVVPNVAQVNLLNSELLYLFYEEMFLLGIHNNLKSRFNRWTKTSFDVVAAFLLCIPLLPLMAGIAVLVAASSPGPILFTQQRVGRNGRIFKIYKFRTMLEGSELLLEKILKENPELESEYRKNRKLKNDPRITSVGRLLRRTSLDELPQLFNVLRGDMSLVGPRPAIEEEMAEHYRDLESEYGLVKPGLTGLWQVSGRNTHDFSMRVRLDLWYIRNWSLWLDLVILVRTVGVVLGRKGAV